ncbi:hypothetical protein KVM46_06930 [Helicobacter pylori]|nr:hypothetical protein KVM46_06930 [Helicobacter pylori]
MLGLVVSGALLFGKEADFRVPKIEICKDKNGVTQFRTDIDPQKELDKIDASAFDLTNKENTKTFFKFVVLAHQKGLEVANNIALLNDAHINTTAHAVRTLQKQVARMEAELKVLHDQLVDLVAKQR